jgi:hypothetical protein
MASPVNRGKRKTVVVTGEGTKKLMNTEELMNFQDQQKDRLSKRRNNKNHKISDVFGDFFGFGPNPPGCMAKDAPRVDFKGEKEKVIETLKTEMKTYDIEAIKIDLNNKQNQIAIAIRKEEKSIVHNEERQLRNLDKLDYMSQYLQEDNVHTKQSLLEAQQIRDQSKSEMQTF